jgi:hypothetical protein
MSCNRGETASLTSQSHALQRIPESSSMASDCGGAGGDPTGKEDKNDGKCMMIPPLRVHV